MVAFKIETLDDLIEENNRRIIASGGPKQPTKAQLAEDARVIAAAKKQRAAAIRTCHESDALSNEDAQGKTD